MDNILQEYHKHRATGETNTNEEKLEPAENFKAEELAGREIVEKDGKKFVKMMVQKKELGYKLFKDAILL